MVRIHTGQGESSTSSQFLVRGSVEFKEGKKSYYNRPHANNVTGMPDFKLRESMAKICNDLRQSYTRLKKGIIKGILLLGGLWCFCLFAKMTSILIVYAYYIDQKNEKNNKVITFTDFEDSLLFLS